MNGRHYQISQDGDLWRLDVELVPTAQHIGREY